MDLALNLDRGLIVQCISARVAGTSIDLDGDTERHGVALVLHVSLPGDLWRLLTAQVGTTEDFEKRRVARGRLSSPKCTTLFAYQVFFVAETTPDIDFVLARARRSELRRGWLRE
jgi:hypothetical protein